MTPTNTPPPLDKNALLKAFKGDLKAADVLKKDWDMRINEWKNAYDGGLYGNEKKGKSKIVSRDIKKQSEWQHASIIDPFVSNDNIISCNPITYEDTKAARQNELLLNTQFVRQFDRYNFMSKAVKVLEREGTLVVQTGWDYQEEKVQVETDVVTVNELGVTEITKQVVEDTKVKRNQPTAKVCRNEDIFIDPTCMDDLDNAQFIIYRYETDLSTLRQDGRYKNLDKVARAMSGEDLDYIPQDTTAFHFEDDPRKKLLVYEYWGNYDVNNDGIAEPIVCSWVNDVIIRLQSNPYPDGKPPFLVVPFNSVPFQIHGEANAALIGDNQKIKTAIIRGLIDNMAQSNNGQVGMRKGALDAVNRKKWLNGNNFEFNGSPSDFWQGSYNQLPSSAFDMLGLMNNEIESLTGVKSFSGGITGNSLGATATGARGALDATSTRRLNIVRNISENLVKPLMRKWIAYNSEFLNEEEVVRVTNEQFVPIRKDDLQGRIDISIEVSTAEDNAAKSQELSFLLQTVGPSEDPSIRREIMAQIMDLMKMPEQARKIRTYKPQPDPTEEQLKQLQLQKLQLENELLQANIAEQQSLASENSADKELKRNKAAVEAAKARKLESEADLHDLKFLKEDEGVDHEQRMVLEDFKRKANLDQMAFQAMHGDHNIGVTK